MRKIKEFIESNLATMFGIIWVATLLTFIFLHACGFVKFSF